MDVEVTFTGVPVSELAAGRAFFERLIGRPPDMVVNANEVMWRLADPAWLYLVVDPERAGHALTALSVGDLNATLAELAGRGVSAESVEDVGDAGRKATVIDPDGNSVALIEVPG